MNTVIGEIATEFGACLFGCYYIKVMWYITNVLKLHFSLFYDYILASLLT